MGFLDTIGDVREKRRDKAFEDASSRKKKIAGGIALASIPVLGYAGHKLGQFSPAYARWSTDMASKFSGGKSGSAQSNVAHQVIQNTDKRMLEVAKSLGLENNPYATTSSAYLSHKLSPSVLSSGKSGVIRAMANNANLARKNITLGGKYGQGFEFANVVGMNANDVISSQLSNMKDYITQRYDILEEKTQSIAIPLNMGKHIATTSSASMDKFGHNLRTDDQRNFFDNLKNKFAEINRGEGNVSSLLGLARSIREETRRIERDGGYAIAVNEYRTLANKLEDYASQISTPDIKQMISETKSFYKGYALIRDLFGRTTNAQKLIEAFANRPSAIKDAIEAVRILGGTVDGRPMTETEAGRHFGELMSNFILRNVLDSPNIDLDPALIETTIRRFDRFGRSESAYQALAMLRHLKSIKPDLREYSTSSDTWLYAFNSMMHQFGIPVPMVVSGNNNKIPATNQALNDLMENDITVDQAKKISEARRTGVLGNIASDILGEKGLKET